MNPEQEGATRIPVEGYVDIEVELTDEQAKHLVLAGMFTLEADGVLQITERGSAWLQGWCDAEMAKAKEAR